MIDKYNSGSLFTDFCEAGIERHGSLFYFGCRDASRLAEARDYSVA